MLTRSYFQFIFITRLAYLFECHCHCMKQKNILKGKKDKIIKQALNKLTLCVLNIIKSFPFTHVW